jgi:hypothetical protein
VGVSTHQLVSPAAPVAAAVEEGEEAVLDIHEQHQVPYICTLYITYMGYMVTGLEDPKQRCCRHISRTISHSCKYVVPHCRFPPL